MNTYSPDDSDHPADIFKGLAILLAIFAFLRTAFLLALAFASPPDPDITWSSHSPLIFRLLIAAAVAFWAGEVLGRLGLIARPRPDPSAPAPGFPPSAPKPPSQDPSVYSLD